VTGEGPDPVRCYWQVGSRDLDDPESLRVYSAVSGEHIGTFLSPRLALAAVGGHNRDLKLDRLVVLDAGQEGGVPYKRDPEGHDHG